MAEQIGRRRDSARRGPASRTGIKEVAERAGVAISSVSRVLSDHPDVSDEMRAKVMAAVDQVGYRPDFLAQSLRRRQTMSIGFVASYIGNPVLAETITGAERALRGAGYSMLITDAEGDPALDREHVEVLAHRRVDALLLSLSDERDPAVRSVLEGLDVPVVFVDRDVPAGMEAPQVRFDHRSGMREAARSLWDHGHRRIALITGGPRRPARERRTGVEDVFKQKGGEPIAFEGPFTVEYGTRATLQALDLQPAVTAIVAAGNLYLRGALRGLRERGLVAGRDIAVVGCDDVAVAEFHEPPIAVVTRDTTALGDLAARVILAELGVAAEVPEAEREMPTEFLLRPTLTQV